LNKDLKDALQVAFEAPPPVNKNRFLRTLRYPKITYFDFLLSQFSYIHKRVWIFSIFLVCMGQVLVSASEASSIHWYSEGGGIWIVSAVLPFLSLLTVTEIYRSAFYHIAELEISCRFSLPQIVMARIGILGVGSFVVLMFILISMNKISSFGLMALISYLIAPYTMTCSLCLWILSRIRGQESIYSCAAATCFISILYTAIRTMVPFLYSDSYLKYWWFFSATFILLVALQLYKLIKQMGDKTWNLFLTE